MIAGGYKLIEYRTENLKLTQVFDLARDPWEMNNLFDTPGYDAVTAKLREELFRLRDEWDDEKNEFGRLYWDCLLYTSIFCSKICAVCGAHERMAKNGLFKKIRHKDNVS